MNGGSNALARSRYFPALMSHEINRFALSVKILLGGIPSTTVDLVSGHEQGQGATHGLTSNRPLLADNALLLRKGN